MIIITGAAGFIGSCLVARLNELGRYNLVLVDDFDRSDKERNWRTKGYIAKVDRDQFIPWLDRMHANVELVFHLGARTDTTEQDEELFDRLNLHYSQAVWQSCSQYAIPLIYASSAATYGDGNLGYDDDHGVIESLVPLNPYGRSKNDFDRWVMTQSTAPPNWYGLKFFNVYGPNEYHKGRMASVIFHTLRQINSTGGMKLFRSHRSDFADGEQSRDFIYVKDVAAVMLWLSEQRPASGLYNLGTGKARTFRDLASATFRAMGQEPNISFIDTPEDIRDTYQYFTEATMQKLVNAGYSDDFHSLESGIADYVQQYLADNKIW